MRPASIFTLAGPIMMWYRDDTDAATYQAAIRHRIDRMNQRSAEQVPQTLAEIRRQVRHAVFPHHLLQSGRKRRILRLLGERGTAGVLAAAGEPLTQCLLLGFALHRIT